MTKKGGMLSGYTRLAGLMEASKTGLAAICAKSARPVLLNGFQELSCMSASSGHRGHFSHLPFRASAHTRML